MSLGVGAFAIRVFACTFVGTGRTVIPACRAAPRRRARSPGPLAVVSFAHPIAAGDTATSTEHMLARQVLAAAIVIPALT